MVLLCLANQLGRKMSKLSWVESEYFLATTVKGQDHLNSINIMPSTMTIPMDIQVYTLMWLNTPA